MTRLLLHIGQHRTGMGRLQQRLHAQREILEQAGILYPDLGGGQGHQFLAASWISLPGRGAKSAVARAEKAELAWSRLEAAGAEAQSRGGDRVILLSAEAFSRMRPQQIDWADLARRLSGFSEVRILVTLRHQLALLPALWLELARNQRPPQPEGFVAAALKSRIAAGAALDPRLLLQAIRRGFAPEQIRFLDHGRLAQQPQGLWSALLDQALPGGRGAALATGLADLPGESDPPLQQEDEAQPLAMFAAARIAAPARPDPALAARLAAQMNGQMSGVSSLLTRAETAALRAMAEAANAAFAAEIHAQQPDFQLQPPPEADLFREDMTALFWRDLAQGLYRDLPGAMFEEAPHPLRRIWQHLRHRLPLQG